VEIRQAFDNVIANALEAAPFNGTLIVHLFDSRDWRELQSSGCRLLVLDDGPGIPQEHRSKIFEPFFTTKIEKGTGIGLWVVRRIVIKHRGSIHVRSSTRSPRTGTAVSLFFPATAIQVKPVGAGQEAA
jgi:two-component system NtrC family sensor kinase